MLAALIPVLTVIHFAALLGPHFSIEHRVRYQQGLFFNFNGTAGIWRRKAIEDAGGWQADTVTEDLDLSYRAQLAGWRSISLSVLKGLFCSGGTFERTPKFGVKGRERLPGLAFLYYQKNLPYIAMNCLLLLYCLLPLLFAWQRGTWFALPLFLLFPFGFALVASKDLVESFSAVTFSVAPSRAAHRAAPSP